MTKTVLALAIALAGITLAESALAGGRTRVSVGIGVGVPMGFGYGYGYPHYGYRYGYGYAPYPYYYYYPPYYSAPVVVQQQPTIYVEQPQAQQVQQPTGYWYFCNDSRAYYPYVKECPSGWQRVAPQPE